MKDDSEVEEIESWSDESIKQCGSTKPTLFGLWDEISERWITLGTEPGWGSQLSPQVFFTRSDAEKWLEDRWFGIGASVEPLNDNLPELFGGKLF